MPDAVCLIAMTACARFSVNITGPSNIYFAGTYTWTANVADEGGGASYSYQWEQSFSPTSGWSQVGTNAPTHQVTFSPQPGGSFTIYLRVTATTGGQSVTSAPYTVRILFK